MLGLALLAFVLGIAAMGWLVSRWGPARSLFVGDTVASGRGAAGVDVAGGLPAPVPVAPLPAPSAITEAGRSEGLLLAFAARRAIDRGQALGQIEPLLWQRFGERHPQLLVTIAAAARQPVTRELLVQRLEQASDPLLRGAADESWLDGAGRAFSNLVVVHRAGQPSQVPAERLARAKRLTEAGRIDAALAEVRALPGRDAAAPWIADAARYVEARRALDALEKAAILAPPAAPPSPPPASDGETRS
jgi:hypothetical protein